MTSPTLASFGVRASDPRSYLLDIDCGIIIAEGAPAAVTAKVDEWEEVAPGRYQAVSGDEADSGALYAWEQFKARTPGYWVIR
ncbi:MAG: hypothetical protein PHX00_13465 [Synergistaceae bacterium]|nr:hypothetical protein [Synergistaceae bacterium]